MVSRLRLVVVCGSLSDGRRLLEAARMYRIVDHLRYSVVIPHRDDTVTPEIHAREWEQWIDHANLVVGVRKPDGSLGESASREVAYARQIGVRIKWYWPECKDRCPGCGWHQPAVPMAEKLGWLECEECGATWPCERPQDLIKGSGNGRLRVEYMQAQERRDQRGQRA